MNNKVSDNLPLNWCCAELGNIADYINGRAFKPSEWSDTGLPIIRIQNLNNEEAKFNYCNFDIDKKFYVTDGDLLFAWSGTPDTSFGAHLWQGGKAVLNQHIFRISFNENLINKSFYCYALKFVLQSFIEQAHGGAGLAHITKKKFEVSTIPLAPLAEQKRIVDKLDALMEEVDAAREKLDSFPETIKKFRQSVLAQAVTGKLTEEWRKENPELESPNEIISSIRKLRLSEVAKLPKKVAIINAIYNEVEVGDHHHIPDQWRFVQLNKLCSSFSYGSSQKSDNEGDVPVLRMGNLQGGKIDWSDLKYSSDSDEINKYNLQVDDVLFNRTNSPELVGKTAIYKAEEPAIYAGYLIKVGNYKEYLNSDYLNICLNSLYAKLWCREVKTDGVSQSNINAQKLSKFEIPFTSITEQKEIVKKVEALFAYADQLEEAYERAKESVDQLPQSILAKAFKGELVPQDPNDEPASVLLERIKEERAKPKAKKEKKGKTGQMSFA
jgi:type I restriction enzyme, S subunit